MSVLSGGILVVGTSSTVTPPQTGVEGVSNLLANQASSNQVAVTFDEPADVSAIDNYQIFFDSGAGESLLATIQTGTNSYTHDVTLADAQSYSYRVSTIASGAQVDTDSVVFVAAVILLAASKTVGDSFTDDLNDTVGVDLTAHTVAPLQGNLISYSASSWQFSTADAISSTTSSSSVTLDFSPPPNFDNSEFIATLSTTDVAPTGTRLLGFGFRASASNRQVRLFTLRRNSHAFWELQLYNRTAAGDGVKDILVTTVPLTVSPTLVVEDDGVNITAYFEEAPTERVTRVIDPSLLSNDDIYMFASTDPSQEFVHSIGVKSSLLPTAVRKQQLTLSNINANSSAWGFEQSADPDIAYIEADTDGFYVLDTTDPENAVHLSTVRAQEEPQRGTHNGSGNSTVLLDSTKTWAVDEYVNYIIDNVTQGYQVAITSNTVNTASGNRIGGGAIDWDAGDEYILTKVSSTSVTDIKVAGNRLYAAARNVNFTTPKPGLFIIYDITDPSNPIWLNTYQPASELRTVPPSDLTPPPSGPTFDQDVWYQGIALDPSDATKVYLASQTFGLDVLDVTDPLNIFRAGKYSEAELKAEYPNWANDRLYHEASRISFQDNSNGKWVALSEHGNGTFLINIDDPANPNNMQWLDSYAADSGFGTPTDLRTRNSVIDNGYLFEINNDANVASPERGLVVRNILNPEDPITQAVIHVPVGVADNDTPYDGIGDEPILDLTLYKNKIYIPNGKNGYFVFNVENPLLPVALGTVVVTLPAGTVLYSVFLYEKNGKDYIMYSDGKEATQAHELFVDEIIGA